MEELVRPNKRTDNPLANERRGIDVSPEKVHNPLSKHMKRGSTPTAAGEAGTKPRARGAEWTDSGRRERGRGDAGAPHAAGGTGVVHGAAAPEDGRAGLETSHGVIT